MRTAKIQKKARKLPEAARLPESPENALQTVRQQLDRLTQSVADGEVVGEQAGDFLFAVVDAVRLLGLEPEYTLTLACERFLTAFERQEQDMQRPLSNNLHA